jgi:cytochrome c oxidase subunit IV
VTVRGIWQWLLRDSERPIALSLIIFAVVIGGFAYTVYYFNIDPNNRWVDKVALVAFIAYAPILVLILLRRLRRIFATIFTSFTDVSGGNPGQRGDDGR